MDQPTIVRGVSFHWPCLKRRYAALRVLAEDTPTQARNPRKLRVLRLLE